MARRNPAVADRVPCHKRKPPTMLDRVCVVSPLATAPAERRRSVPVTMPRRHIRFASHAEHGLPRWHSACDAARQKGEAMRTHVSSVVYLLLAASCGGAPEPQQVAKEKSDPLVTETP